MLTRILVVGQFGNTLTVLTHILELGLLSNRWRFYDLS